MHLTRCRWRISRRIAENGRVARDLTRIPRVVLNPKKLTHEKASGLKQSGLQPPHLPHPAALKIVSATYCRLNMKSGKNTGQERLSRFSSGKISTLTLEPRAWVMSKPHREGICYIPVQWEHDILKCLLIASGRQGNDHPGFVFQPAEQIA